MQRQLRRAVLLPWNVGTGAGYSMADIRFAILVGLTITALWALATAIVSIIDEPGEFL